MIIKYYSKRDKCRKTLDMDLILNLYNNEKLNLNKISKYLNIPNNTLRQFCKKYNVLQDINTGYQVLKTFNYFDTIDTEHKAYILGYIIADGCISVEPKKRNGEIYSYNKRLTFTVSIDDEEIIKEIQKEISPKTPIYYVQNNTGAKNRKLSCRFRISDRYLVDKLISYGIKPRKTFDYDFVFPFEIIPEHLQHHFMRGYFDGDGSAKIEGICLQICFNSEPFMDQCNALIQQNFSCTFRKNKIQGKTCEYWKYYLNTNKTNSKDFYSWLYKDATIYLRRKFNKINKFNIVNTVLT